MPGIHEALSSNTALKRKEKKGGRKGEREGGTKGGMEEKKPPNLASPLGFMLVLPWYKILQDLV